MTDDSPVLDITQAAEYLGFPVRRMAYWVWEAKDAGTRCTPSGYIGRSPYWTRQDLDTWRAEKYRERWPSEQASE